MKFHVVGSYLPQDYLVKARRDLESGAIDATQYRAIEDRAVRELVELQLQAGTPSVSGGELRRRSWDRDFYFGLKGISHDRVDGGRVYQDSWAYSDQMRFDSRINYNPGHPFFEYFTFLYDSVDGRARCRQTLPSPADLYLTIVEKSKGNIARMYPAPDKLKSDIVDAYRRTIQHFYDLGCRSIQLDDSACGRLSDPNSNFIGGLLLGGVDLMQLFCDIVGMIDDTIKDWPDDLWTSLYLSSGPSIVPQWSTAATPDNIMRRVLALPDVDRFYLPFNTSKPESAAVLKFVNDHAAVALGLVQAHSPFHDKLHRIIDFVDEARRYIQPDSRLSISPMTGFKLSSYESRGLNFNDQWRKIDDIKHLAETL